MGIVKDWVNEYSGYRLRSKVVRFLSPRVWLRLHKWRAQRANRGWSDRDTWNAGDHIAKMTAEMLQYLNDYSYTDWESWFDHNIKDGSANTYQNIQLIIDDINGYLNHQETSWSDDLELSSYDLDDLFVLNDDGNYQFADDRWVTKKDRKPVSQKQITARINKWHKQEIKLYKKATKAMKFFGSQFSSFWD